MPDEFIAPPEEVQTEEFITPVEEVEGFVAPTEEVEEFDEFGIPIKVSAKKKEEPDLLEPFRIQFSKEEKEPTPLAETPTTTFTELQEKPKPPDPEELSSLQSIKNSMKNVHTIMRGFKSELAITSAEFYEAVLGDENARKFYELHGSNIDESKKKARDILEYLDSKILPTKGLVESVKKQDAGDVAAAIFGAGSNLVASGIPALGTLGTSIITSMVGRGIDNFNKAKAENIGITVNELYDRNEEDFVVPATIHGVAALLDLYGMKGIGSAISKQMKGPMLKKINDVFAVSTREGGTEWVQLGMETYSNSLGGGKSQVEAIEAAANIMLSEQGLETFSQGFVGAGVITLGGRALKSTLSKVDIDNLQKVNLKDEQEINSQIQDHINRGEFSVSEAVEKKKEFIKDVEAAKKMEGGKIPEGKEGEVHELIKEKTKLTDQQAEADETIAETIEPEIKKVDEKLREALELELEALKVKEEPIKPKEDADKIKETTEEIREKERIEREEAERIRVRDIREGEEVAEAKEVKEEVSAELSLAELKIEKAKLDKKKAESIDFPKKKQALLDRINKAIERREITEKERVVPEMIAKKSPESQKFIQDVMEMGELEPQTIMGIGISKAQISQAIRNVREGKKTKASDLFLEKMDEFVEQGWVDMSRGKGMFIEYHQVPLEEFSGAVTEETITPIEQAPDEIISQDKDVVDAIEDFATEDGNINWEALKNKIETDEGFFKIFPFDLNDKQFNELKLKTDEQVKELREEVEGVARPDQVVRAEDQFEPTVKDIERQAEDVGRVTTEELEAGIKAAELLEKLKQPVEEGKAGDIFYTGRGSKIKEFNITRGEYIFFSKNKDIAEWYGGDESNITKATIDTKGFLDLSNQENKAEFVRENFTEKDIHKLFPAIRERTLFEKDIPAEVSKSLKNLEEETFSADNAKQKMLLDKVKELGYPGIILRDSFFGKGDNSYIVIDKSRIGTIEEKPQPPVEPPSKEKIEKAKAKTAEGIDEFLSSIGGLQEITGENRKKAIDGLRKAAEGLIEQGIARAENVIIELKKSIDEKWHKFIDENIDEITPVPKKEVEPEKRKKSLLNRAYEGTIDKDIKSSIEDIGLDFEIENWETAKQKSKDFIKQVGVDGALDAVRKNLIEDGAQAFIWADIIDDIGKRKTLAKTDAEQAQWSAKEAGLLDEFDRKVRSGGRFISALQDVYKNSDFGYDLNRRIKDYKDLNEGVIPAEVEARFRQADKQLKEIKTKLAEAEKRAEQAEDDLLIANIKASTKRRKKKDKPEPPLQKGKDLIAEGVQDLSQALGIIKMAHGEKRPEVSEALAKIGRGLMDEGLATADNVIQKIKEYVDENFKGKVDFNKHKSKVDKTLKDWISDVTEGEVKIPRSIIRDFVERGIDNIDDLTKSVKKVIKEDFPDATDRQVRDAITGYGKTSNLTKDEITSQINRMKRVGKLISGLEDVRNKKIPAKSERRKAKLDEQEIELKRQLQELTKELQIETGEFDAKRLQQAKIRAEKRIEELQQRVKVGDFATKKPRPIFADTELNRIKAEKEKWQEVMDKEKLKLEIKNRTKLEKLADIGLELFSSLWRTFAASIDFSATLVQNALPTVRHPRDAFKSLVEMFKQFASDEYHQSVVNKIKSQDWFPEMKAAGLDITEIGGKYNAREEMFVSNWVDLIWEAPANLLEKAINKNKASEKWKKINAYKAANRAFVGYSNTMRILRYLEGSNHLKQMGETFESNPQAYKAWADYVNNLTARGGLGKLESSSKALSLVFFSPRKLMSGLNLLTPYSLVYFGKMPKAVRMKAILDYASSLAIMTSIAVMWQAANESGDNDDDWGEFWNPDSSDFLKPKIGNTRVDLFRGLQQNVVLMSRVITGRFTSSTGLVSKLGERFGKDINTRWDLLGKYLSNKFTPSLAFARKALNQKKGLEVEWIDESTKQFLPIWLRDVNELYKEHPIEISVMLNILALFGGGVQTYETKEMTEDEKEKLQIKLKVQEKMRDLSDRHPDWDEEKLKEVAEELIL